jgi:hypothetical protein
MAAMTDLLSAVPMAPRDPILGVTEAFNADGMGDIRASDRRNLNRIVAHEDAAGQQLARGIIDRGDERQHRPAILEPAMATAVPEQHQAALGLAVAPPPMLTRSPSPDRPNAAGTQNATDRTHGDIDGRCLVGEFLRKVCIVEVAVRRAPQCEDACAGRRGDRVRWRSTSVAMHEGITSLALDAASEPTHLTRGESQRGVRSLTVPSDGM